MASVAFYTLGCKVNQQETDAIRAMFIEAGYDILPFDDIADIYIINTCTLTTSSDKKSRQIISRAHAKNPDAAIAVVGCYAQRAADEVLALPGVSLVTGAKNRHRLIEWLKQGGISNAVEDISDTREFEALPDPRGVRSRYQLKVQDGCDRYCAYCIVPYARGPARSLPLNEASAAIGRIGQTGELVLTGIHLMSYGRDLPDKPDLAELIKLAAAHEGIGRLRLGSIDPALVDDRFVDAISGIDKLCPHFHISLQSGSDTVLSRMGRRYTPEEYRAVTERLRRAFPGCAITTDVIAGFPGETNTEHEDTMRFIREIGFARLHVFPYSRREGTKAYAMPGQVRRIEKERRAKELIALGRELEKAYVSSKEGGEYTVLIEECTDGWSEGYTEYYIRARVPFEGEGLVKVRAMGAQDNVLLCERISDIIR